MIIQFLTLRLHLPGCRSLKEKRRRISGFKDKLGKMSNIAISESNYHDLHQQAEWGVIIMAGDKQTVERIVAQVEAIIEQMDALLINMTREYL